METIREQVLQAQKCERLSDFVDYYFTEPFAMAFSKIFIKLKISPNLITLFSLIFGVIGGVFFYFQNILYNAIGIVLEIFAAVFDTSDGQVARLTNKKSAFGRIFDGVADGLVYFSIYFFISLRLMGECIPFTDVPWGGWIWIVSVVCCLGFHARQARMADYFRNVHMYFKMNKRGNELSLSKNLLDNIKSKKGSFLKNYREWGYYFYTKSQERYTPNLQKLLLKIQADGGTVSENISKDFSSVSDKVVRLTNFLTFNFRSYILFILILFSCHFFIFPVILLVIEPIAIFITFKYEAISKTILKKYFHDKAEANEI